MNVEKDINVLSDAIKRLEDELVRAPTKARRAEIVELLQTVKAMRVAIIAKEGVSTSSKRLETAPTSAPIEADNRDEIGALLQVMKAVRAAIKERESAPNYDP